MKAIRIHETGGPEVLSLDDVPMPHPAAGQLLVRVGASGVNFTDVMARQGVYVTREAALTLPATLGTEVAGIVTEVGVGVDANLVGRRVVAFAAGGYAEFALARADLAFVLPDSLDLTDAVAFLVQGVTAWELLRDCARLREGDTVLVHSGAGGVGTLAVQLARELGAGRVFATAGSPAKRELAVLLGAEALDYTTAEWSRQILDATDGVGVDIILDAVGGDIGEESLTCLAPFGRLVVYGVSSKRLASFAGTQLMHKNQSVSGYWLTSRFGAGGSPGLVVPQLIELARRNRLRSVVKHVFPLEGAAQAHQAIADRRTVGKVVLVA